MGELIAGVDSSTQSVKIVVRDADTGELVAQSRAPHPDGTEINPEIWWQALQKVISDIGSGLNFNRKGFCKLLEAIITGTVAEVVVAYKDRLCRFGYEMFENLCKHFSTTITIVDYNNDKSSTQELAEDLLSIITVFTARFYGQRKYNSSR